MRWKRRRRRRESDEEEEAELEVWRRSRRRRERGEKARGEGGFEEAALRTRRDQCGGKAREGEEGKHTQKGRQRKKRRGSGGGEEGKARESETGETSRANFNANELLHWQIIRGSHLASRFFSKSSSGEGTRRRNSRVIIQVPASHRGRLRNLRGVSIFRGSLLEYHERVGSNRT